MDSARWDEFDLRRGDIVISAPAKSGTTWTQMICALLVFQTPELPAPLTVLSPWLDMVVHPIGEIRDRLAAQDHRRFIKTHTPLDGLPVDDRVTYIAVGRDPRDVALSLHHHRDNVDRDVLARLTSRAGREQPTDRPAVTWDVRETFRRWMTDDTSPLEYPGTLRALVRQQNLAWSRRDDPNVVLVHYGDLSRDLDAEMRRIAGRLGIPVSERTWPALVAAATFDRMRERSAQLVPDERLGIFTDPRGFFREGSSEGWREQLTDGDAAAYRRRLGSLASPELVHWLHHGTATARTGRDSPATPDVTITG